MFEGKGLNKVFSRVSTRYKKKTKIKQPVYMYSVFHRSVKVLRERERELDETRGKCFV